MTTKYHKHSTLKRDGYPPMTSAQLRELEHLRTCLEQGNPWSTKKIVPRVVRKLQRLYLIFVSPDPTGHAPTAYKILPAGLELLKAFTVHRRTDGICPRCNTTPRRVRKTGQLANYCHPCERAYHREVSAKRLTHHTDRPCVECGQRPRAVSEFGWQYARCRECQTAYAAGILNRWNERRMAQIKAGETIMCVCGKAAVHVTEHKVEQYCLDCLNRYYRNLGRRKRRMQRVLRQQRNRSGSEAAD